MKKRQTTTIWFLVTVGLLIADQAIKQLVRINRPILNLKILRIEFVQNTGASFGMLNGNNPLFIWISIIVLGGIMLYFDKFSKAVLNDVILISGGIFSNLIDRVLFKGVIDYINFGWWPVFNLADSMIVIGVALLIITLQKEDRYKGSGKRKKRKVKKIPSQ